jgi:hypothetical protein
MLSVLPSQFRENCQSRENCQPNALLANPRWKPPTQRRRAALRTVFGATTLAVVLLGVLSPPAEASGGVGPGQAFTGRVNGAFSDAVVTVICPGPGGPLLSGHPAAGQELEVLSPPPPVAYGVKVSVGLTGTRGRAIVARFTDDSSVTTTFDRYFTIEPIPTSLLLPCSGKGKVVFRPTPGSPDARKSVVSVSYLNPAVGPTSRSRYG